MIWLIIWANIPAQAIVWSKPCWLPALIKHDFNVLVLISGAIHICILQTFKSFWIHRRILDRNLILLCLFIYRNPSEAYQKLLKSLHTFKWNMSQSDQRRDHTGWATARGTCVEAKQNIYSTWGFCKAQNQSQLTSAALWCTISPEDNVMSSNIA